MQNLQSLETGALLEMLLKNTTDYRKMLEHESGSQQFSDCESNIILLEAMINSRLINKFNATSRQEATYQYSNTFQATVAVS
ncbi:MAG: hypothetical protein V4725_10235 [Bacteroidota bacterium]|nr:hypothetical protein [Ferruginibacter sp.]